MIGRLIKYIFILGILGFIGLLGFSYLGDISAPKSEVTVPVDPQSS